MTISLLQKVQENMVQRETIGGAQEAKGWVGMGRFQVEIHILRERGGGGGGYLKKGGFQGQLYHLSLSK